MPTLQTWRIHVLRVRVVSWCSIIFFLTESLVIYTNEISKFLEFAEIVTIIKVINKIRPTIHRNRRRDFHCMQKIRNSLCKWTLKKIQENILHQHELSFVMFCTIQRYLYKEQAVKMLNIFNWDSLFLYWITFQFWKVLINLQVYLKHLKN